MNPITFNDHFEHVFAVYPHQPLVTPFGPNWKTAPLFDYLTTYEHEQDQVRKKFLPSQAELGDMPWPFETFRLALAETVEPFVRDGKQIGRGTYETRYVVARHDGRVFVIVHVHEMWDRPAGGSNYPRDLTFLISDVYQSRSGPPDSYDYKFSFYAQGKWRIPPVTGPGSAVLQELVTATMTALVTFLVDSMEPGSHIATVHPNKPGKSVEWIRSRTHYTMITHGHPANKPMREGARVSSDREGELHRMAHNRRAHYRTLRHERYRFARGQRIPVRATWVGPKEWQDEGGRQIYRILEPVDGSAVAA